MKHRYAAHLLSFGLLCSSCASSDYRLAEGFEAGMDEVSGEPFFTVWRGFEHKWTHNHRWNRFGNWAAPSAVCDEGDTCWSLHHSGASGSSEDIADFSSHVTVVDQGDMGFVQVADRVTYALEFKYQSWRQGRTVAIPLADLPEAQASSLRDRELVAFLNGFDLGALEGSKAAKPIDFMIDITGVRYDSVKDTIFVEWSSYLQMGCSTEECGLPKRADYKIDVQLAVVATDEVIATEPVDYRHLYGWDAPPDWLSLGHGRNPDAKELAPNPQTQTLKVGTDVSPVPAVTRLSMHLFHWNANVKKTDMHMVEWRSYVRADYDYDSEVALTSDLLFKNWVPNMRDYQFFAYEDIGAANLEMGVRLLKLPWYGARDAVWSGLHSWQGKGAPAFGDDAISSTVRGDR